MFKSFIVGKGLSTIFINFYKGMKIGENPKSIEQFLMEADAHNVCLSAFYFRTGSVYGFDYWTDAQKRFDEYMVQQQSLYPEEDIQSLQGKSRILRCNWDSPKHWREEGRITAAERLGITLSTDVLKNIIHDNNVRIKKTGGSDEQLKEIRMANEKMFERNGGDLLSEFEMIDLRVTKSGCKLKEDEISYNVRNESSKITFNQTLSYETMVGGGFSFAQLGSNAKGDVCLMLNNERGVNVQKLDNDTKRMNLTISNKALCQKLAALLNIKQDYAILKAEKIGCTESYMAFLLTKK